jgi:ABC transporter DrrB family efflux protein
MAVTTLRAPEVPEGSGLRWAVSDGFTMTWRSLLHTIRVPELLIFSTIQPVMFVLLFAYVFGGSIPLPDGGSYREYLMGGIFTQTVGFATGATAVGLAEDLHRGLVDRFRSLPMARSAVIVGRTVGDSARNILIIVIMMICGVLVGWRVHNGVLEFLAATVLLLLFGYAMCWIGALIGLSVPNPETANTAGFIWLFPLTFLSNAFVAIERLPGWLQPIAAWNPVSATAAALRDLFGNPNPIPEGYWSLSHPVITSLGWSALTIAVFAPLAVRKYRRTATK